MKDIVFVTSSHKDDILQNNLLKSIIFDKYELIVQRGYVNVMKAYNDALKKIHNKIVVYVHHDVFLPNEFESNLIYGIKEIENCDKNWGAIGVIGIGINGILEGMEGTTEDLVGEVCSQGINIIISVDKFKEVQTLDELLLITQEKTIFDENIPGNHFYGADICLQNIKNNKKNYVINAYCYHNSTTNCNNLVCNSEEFQKSKKYMYNKYIDNLPIRTTCTLGDDGVKGHKYDIQ